MSVQLGADGADGGYVNAQLTHGASGSETGLITILPTRDMTGIAAIGMGTANYLHSANTTSSVLYKVRFKTNQTGTSSRFNYPSGTGSTSSIVLMEIGA